MNQSLNHSFKSVTHATYLIVVINCLIWIYIYFMSGEFQSLIMKFGFVPAVFTFNLKHFTLSLDTYYPLVSAIFLHGSWLHIILNMVYLFIFGPELEKKMGRIRFLVFFILCGIGGTLIQYLFSMNGHFVMVGSSGAISGILAGYLLLYSWGDLFKESFHFTWGKIFPYAAILYIISWFIFQVANGIYLYLVQGILTAWLSHVGGFLTGMLTYRFLVLRRKDKKIHYI